MNIILNFLIVFSHYLIDVLPYLVIGFFLSGLIHEFIPTGWIERHLGGRGIKAILYSTFAGTLLPICCWGSLPIAISLHKKGASLGPVLAFLLATPATSITALIVTYGFLGLKFTVFIFFSVVLIGVIIGIVGNLIKLPDSNDKDEEFEVDPVCGMKVRKNGGLTAKYGSRNYLFCSLHCRETFLKDPEKYATVKKVNNEGIGDRFKNVLRYAFIDMVKEIGPELLLGLVLAALIATLAPVGRFIGNYFQGGLGYLFSLIFGLLMYICATSSVPLVHAFISQGMNIGAGMLLLLVGPVTSWGTILVLRKEFGIKTLSIYILILSFLALSLGYIFSLI